MSLLSTISDKVRRSWGDGKSLLVFEHDSFQVRAFHIGNKKNGLLIKDVWTSRLSQVDQAIEEIIRQVKDVKKLPRKAIVVTSEVVPALLDLPLDPKKTRPYQQMHDLVKWEIEPVLAEQTTSRPIGSILIGKSYLNHNQAKEIVHSLEEQNTNLQQADQPNLRFGEHALKKGFINHAQLEECLSMQDHFQFIQDDSVCGWSYQSTEESLEETVKSKWLACGVGKAVRDRWKKSLEKYGLDLFALYPLAASSTAVLNGTTTNTHSAVFEIYNGLISCTQVNRGTIDSVELHHLAEERPSAEICGRLIKGEVDQAYFSGNNQNLKEISDHFSETLEIKSDVLNSYKCEETKGDLKKETFTGVLGAASHAFKLPKTNRISCVLADDPGPPLKSQPFFWVIAAALFIGISVGILDVAMGWKHRSLIKQKELIQSRLDPLEAANEKIFREIELNERLSSALLEKKELLMGSNQHLKFLHQMINERSNFSLYLLKGIAASMPKQVVLNNVVESYGVVEIKGWAITEKSAQQFAQNLSEVMKQKDVHVGELSVRSRLNRVGVSGYAFSLMIKPLLSQEAINKGIEN